MYTGFLASADFEENEITIQVEEELIVKAGKYVVMTMEEYEKLRTNDFPCEHPYAYVSGKKVDLPKCHKCGEYL